MWLEPVSTLGSSALVQGASCSLAARNWFNDRPLRPPFPGGELRVIPRCFFLKPLSYGVFHSPTGLEGGASRIFTHPPGQLRCVSSELEVQAWSIAWVLWVGGNAFAVCGVGEAAAIVIGDWGVAWRAEAGIFFVDGHEGCTKLTRELSGTITHLAARTSAVPATQVRRHLRRARQRRSPRRLQRVADYP